MKHTTVTGATLRKNASHIIIHQSEHRGPDAPYELWSQHMTYESGARTMRALGRNRAMGHYRLTTKSDGMTLIIKPL